MFSDSTLYHEVCLISPKLKKKIYRLEGWLRGQPGAVVWLVIIATEGTKVVVQVEVREVLTMGRASTTLAIR